jgi:hypothetical protein
MLRSRSDNEAKTSRLTIPAAYQSAAAERNLIIRQIPFHWNLFSILAFCTPFTPAMEHLRGANSEDTTARYPQCSASAYFMHRGAARILNDVEWARQLIGDNEFYGMSKHPAT